MMKENGRKIRLWKVMQKSIYVICLFILVLLLLIQTIQCLVKYLGNPTYVSTDIALQKKASFPAITVCPISSGYKEEVLKENGIESIRKYNYKTDLNWSSNKTGVSEGELFDSATYSLDELVQEIHVRFFKANPADDDKTSTKLTLDPGDPSISEQRHRNFGKCYTIHPEQYILNLGVYYMKINFKQDVKVYFHQLGQFLDLSGRMGYKFYIGDTAQAQLTSHEIIMLSKKDEETGEPTCTNTVYDTCMYNALKKHMHERTQDEGGCTVPWIMDGDKGPENICKKPNNINITFWEAWDRVTNQKNDCPSPCEILLVSVGAKNFEADDTKTYGLLYLYFAPRTMISEEHYYYTILSLFAEIGGYVGLLLGFSLFHLAEWCSGLIDVKIKALEDPKADDMLSTVKTISIKSANSLKEKVVPH